MLEGERRNALISYQISMMNSNCNQNLKATILEIQRMSTEDGPGLRTTVFFKGCSLKCKWCHNPESIASQPQVHWIGNRCIGCNTCLEVCPENALAFAPEGNTIDRSQCTGCGVCAEECPSTALELLGQSWKLDDLYSEIIKDKTYFDKSNGGVTLGGGEPLLQSDFCKHLLIRLKENALHTAVDTCGLVSRKALDRILPHTDLLLYDLKEMNPRKHELFTGSDNHIILENLISNAIASLASYGSEHRSFPVPRLRRKMSEVSVNFWAIASTVLSPVGICALSTICAGINICDWI